MYSDFFVQATYKVLLFANFIFKCFLKSMKLFDYEIIFFFLSAAFDSKPQDYC